MAAFPHATGADAAFIGETFPAEGGKRIRTLAMFRDGAPAQTRKFTVLLVDDEEMIREAAAASSPTCP